jgi:hypothetical protein
MKSYLLIILFSLPVALVAQLKSYSYFRELKPVSEEAYYELKIGSAVLDRAGCYRVYELTSKDTVEVPYIAGENFYDAFDKTYFKSVRIIDKTYESGKASYATLVMDTNLIYNSVYLNFNSSDFFKDVTLEGSSDNKNWKTIIENEKVFDYSRVPNEHYYRNKIVFNEVSFKYIRVNMDDSHSAKIELVAASTPLVKEEITSDEELVPFELKRIEEPDKKRTILECSFNRPYFIAGVQLKIEHENPFYKRNAGIYSLVRNKKKDNWISFGSSTISSNSSNKIILSNYDNGDAGFKTDKLRVIVDNLDDKPLAKINLDVYTHQQNIKLKLFPNKHYILTYGKKNDASPQYDIEYFKNAVPIHLKKAELGTENQIPQSPVVVKQGLITNKMWIWVALIACVALVGFFTLKLLKTGGDK